MIDVWYNPYMFIRAVRCPLHTALDQTRVSSDSFPDEFFHFSTSMERSEPTLVCLGWSLENPAAHKLLLMLGFFIAHLCHLIGLHLSFLSANFLRVVFYKHKQVMIIGIFICANIYLVPLSQKHRHLIYKKIV